MSLFRNESFPLASSTLAMAMKRLQSRRLSSLLGFGLAALGWIHCGGGADTTSCGDIAREADDAINDAVSTARGCSQDSDCLMLDLRFSCIPECSSTVHTVAASSKPDLERRHQMLEEQYCSRLERRQCDLFVPSCGNSGTAGLSVACEGGQCPGSMRSFSSRRDIPISSSRRPRTLHVGNRLANCIPAGS
jgi:hypothetical protein